MAEGLVSLKKKLKELALKRGRHTELISVYIADGYELVKVSNKLFEEQGTASNIKSSTTRKNVTTALAKILQEMKLFKHTPKNGLAIFCGNASETEGRDDYVLETIIPPKPMNQNLYRCSQKFVLEPLEEMIADVETYGIILIERQQAILALLKGKRIEIVKNFDSFIPGKFKAGGQSAARFERVIEGMAKEYYRDIAEVANNTFRTIKDLRGIIIGGPGPTKEEFVEQGNLSFEVKKKILGIYDIGYTDEQGLNEIIEKAKDVLAEAEITKERHIVADFLGHMGKDDGLAVYGLEEVKNALLQGAVETALISEDTDDKVLEELEKQAQDSGSKIMLISLETREGQQIKALGGAAAILRYKIQSR